MIYSHGYPHAGLDQFESHWGRHRNLALRSTAHLAPGRGAR